MLTYSFSRFARICLMRPSRCPDWLFGTKSFRMVSVTLGCSLLGASLSRGSLENKRNSKVELPKIEVFYMGNMFWHRTYILLTEGGGGGGSRWIPIGWLCEFIFFSKFISEKLSSNPRSPEGQRIQHQTRGRGGGGNNMQLIQDK